MHTALEEIREIARQITEKLSFPQFSFFDKEQTITASKKRVEKLLRELKKQGEIVDFLQLSEFKTKKGRKIYSHFIIVPQGKKHCFKFLKVKVSFRAEIRYLTKQIKLRRIYGEKFVEVLSLVAGTQRTDGEVENDLRRILF